VAARVPGGGCGESDVRTDFTATLSQANTDLETGQADKAIALLAPLPSSGDGAAKARTPMPGAVHAPAMVAGCVGVPAGSQS